MTLNVKTWCFINRGSIHISAYFDKNAYAPNEVANVICEIDNSKCSIDMTNIDFVLINRMRFISNAGYSKEIMNDVKKIT